MIYPSATDHLNKQPYAVYVPPYYQGADHAVPERERTTRILTAISPNRHQNTKVTSWRSAGPAYEAFDTTTPQKAMVTISEMVLMNVSSTSFTIIDDYDVLSILHQIDAYVEEVYPGIKDKRYEFYLTRLLKLRDEIYKLFRRVLLRHPSWFEEYDHKNNLFGLLEKLYKPLGVAIDIPQSLLDDLAVCPTVRAHPDLFTNNVVKPRVDKDSGVVYSV